jgi:hypothetical protein
MRHFFTIMMYNVSGVLQHAGFNCTSPLTLIQIIKSIYREVIKTIFNSI